MKLCTDAGDTKMEFERVTELTDATPTAKLCEAWGLSPEEVDARKRAKTPLTIREAGSLAEIYGLRLENILPV